MAMEPDMMPTTSLKAMSAELEAMETAAARDWSGGAVRAGGRRPPGGKRPRQPERLAARVVGERLDVFGRQLDPRGHRQHLERRQDLLELAQLVAVAGGQHEVHAAHPQPSASTAAACAAARAAAPAAASSSISSSVARAYDSPSAVACTSTSLPLPVMTTFMSTAAAESSS